MMGVFRKTLIEFGSPEYDESIDLRTKILRKPLGLEFTEAQLSAEYTDIHLGMYDQEEALVACLVMTPQEDGKIKMRQVAVDLEKQGLGIGRQLVTFSEEVARHYGYKKIVLNARDTAVPFYLALDYQKEGDEFLEVGIKHWAMWKQL